MLFEINFRKKNNIRANKCLHIIFNINKKINQKVGGKDISYMNNIGALRSIKSVLTAWDILQAILMRNSILDPS